MHGGPRNGWVHWPTIGTRQRLRLGIWYEMKPLHNRFGYKITRISNTYLLLTSFIDHIVGQKESLFSSSLYILGLFALYIETSPSVSITIPHFAWELLLKLPICLSQLSIFICSLSLFSFFFSPCTP